MAEDIDEGDVLVVGAPSSNYKVRVFIRFRPYSHHEEDLQVEPCDTTKTLDISDDRRVVVSKSEGTTELFTFDSVFDEFSTQVEVYTTVAESIVADVLAGYNATIFAYGQTGSGKTHTMFGPNVDDATQRGIIPRVCSQLFDAIKADPEHAKYSVLCSMMEIYKEDVRDLLETASEETKHPQSQPTRPSSVSKHSPVARRGGRSAAAGSSSASLNIRETGTGGIFVEGLSERGVSTVRDVMKCVEKGSSARAVGCRELNARSSRSHSIFVVRVIQERKGGLVREAKMNLVDLAGSEKLTFREGKLDEGDQEAIRINLSLSCLKSVINALTEPTRAHIPYRDSKLTRILQDALGGNSKTSLLVTCSSHIKYWPETIRSISFGARAKKIINHVQSNERGLEGRATGAPRVARQGSKRDVEGAFPSNCEATGIGISKAIPNMVSDIIIQARDKEGNDHKRGGDAFRVNIRGPSTAQKKLVDYGNGTYSVKYSVPMSGKYTLNLTLKGQPIQGSPFYVDCRAAHSERTNALLTGRGLKTARAGEPTIVNIVARDQCGNDRVVGGDTITGFVEHTSAKVVDYNDGTYSLTYTLEKMGSYSLHILQDGQHMPQSPFSITVIPGKPHPPNCTVQGTGFMNAVVDTQAHFSITTRDKYGNQCTEGGGNFVIDVEGPVPLEIPVVDNGDGSYDARYRAPPCSGTYLVSISRNFGREIVPGSPFELNILPGPIHSESCVLEGASTGTAGLPWTFSLKACDRFGNACVQGGYSSLRTRLRSEHGPGDEPQGVMCDSGNGVYEGSFTVNQSGSYILSVVADDEKRTIGKPLTLQITPNKRHIPSCTASEFWKKPCTAGCSVSFTLTTRDRYGNARPEGGGVAKVTLRALEEENSSPSPSSSYPSRIELEGTAIDRGNGTYDLTFATDRSGAYEAVVTLDRGHIHGSPFSLEVLPGEVHGPSCCATGEALRNALAGQESSFTILAYDALANRAVRGGCKFTAFLVPADAPGDPREISKTERRTSQRGMGSMRGSSSSSLRSGSTGSLRGPQRRGGAKGSISAGAKECDIRDNNDGTYSVTYRLSKVGPYLVAVTLGRETAIRGSPFRLSVLPAAVYPPNCSLSGPTVGVAGETVRFTVTTADKFGNKRGTGGDAITMQVTAETTTVIDLDVEDHDDGTYSGQLQTVTVGHHSLEAFLGKERITGSPHTLSIQPGLSSASNAVVSGGGVEHVVAGQRASFSVTTMDEFGNKQKRGGALFSVEVEEGPATIRCTTKDNKDGTYSFFYTPTVAGAYVIRILQDGQLVGGAALHVTVEPSKTHAPYCTASMVTTAICGNEMAITLVARDEYRNARISGGDTVEAKVSGVDLVDTEVVDKEDGTYDVVLLPTVAGEYKMALSVNGQPIAESPLRFHAEAGPETISGCTATSFWKNNLTAGKEIQFKVLSRDRWGNKRSRSDSVCEVALEGPETITGRAENAGETGVWTCSFTCLVAGTYRTSVWLQGQHTSGSPFTSTVVAADVDSTQCLVVGSGATTATAGETATLTIVARDKFGNRLGTSGHHHIVAQLITHTLGSAEEASGSVRRKGSVRRTGSSPIALVAESPRGSSRTSGSARMKSTSGGSISRAVGAKKPSCVAGVVEDCGDGSYNVSYRYDRTGEFPLTLTLNGRPVDGSPFPVRILPAAPHPEHSVLRGPKEAIAGVPVSLTLQAIDRFGNKCTTGGAAFALFLTSPEESRPLDLVDKEDGTYEATFTGLVVGEYRVHGQLKDEELTCHPHVITLRASDASASTCTMEGQGLVRAVAGETATFTLLASDEFGNRRTVGGLTFTTECVGPVRLEVLCVDNGDGTFTFSYVPEKTGAYTLSVQLHGTHVATSPYSVAVMATTTHAPQCTIDLVSEATAGEALQFVVQAHDRFGNQRTIGGDTLESILQGPVILPVEVHDVDDGTYWISALPTQCGRYLLTVTLGKTVLAGCPLDINVLPAVCDPAACTASEFWRQPSVAGKKTTFQVVARDRFGNAVGCGGKELLVKVRGPCTCVCAADRGENGGIYHAEFTATVVGCYDVSVSLAGKPIAASPFRCEVEAGEAVAECCSVSGDGLGRIVAGQFVSVCLLARDTYGNPQICSHDAMEAFLHDPTGQLVTSAVIKQDDEKDGTCRAFYTVEKAGQYGLCVRLNGVDVEGSPFPVEVIPGEASAGSCRMSGVQPSLAVAGEGSTVTIFTADAFDNPRSAERDCYEVVVESPDGLTVETHITYGKGDDDKTRVHFVPVTAGRHEVRATLRGESLAGCPFHVDVAAGGSDARQCTAQGEGLLRGVSGSRGEFIVKVADEFGNRKVVGGDYVEATLVGPGDVAVGVTDCEDGTYVCSYVPLLSGKYTLKITVDGLPLQGTPFHVDVLPGPPHPSSCEANLLSRTVAGEEILVLIEGADEYGNKRTCGGGTFKAHLRGTEIQDVPVVDKDNGTYLVSFVPRIAGSLDLSVILEKKHVRSSPMNLTVEPGATYAPFCRISGMDFTQPVTAGEEVLFMLQAMDSLGNPRQKGGDKFTAVCEGPSPVEVPITDRKNGTYECRLRASIVGTYTVSIMGIWKGKQPVAGSPFQMTVVPAQTDAHRTRIVVLPGNMSAGQVIYLQITAVDAFDNLTNRGGDVFMCHVSGNDEDVATKLEDKHDGTYTVSFCPVVSGIHVAHVALGTRPVSGGSIEIPVRASDTDVSRSILSPFWEETICAGRAHVVRIVTCDSFNNRRTVGGDTIEMTMNPVGTTTARRRAEVVRGSVHDKDDGSYEVTLLPSVTGHYRAVVLLNGQNMPRTPTNLHVVPGDTQARKCTLSKLGDGIVGKDCSFFIHARDVCGNDRGIGGDLFSVILRGPATLVANVQDSGDGTYVVTFNHTVAGRYHVEVTLHGDPIEGSPFSLSLRSALSAGNLSTATASDIFSCELYRPATFTIYARDAHGNPMTMGGCKFDVTLSDNFAAPSVGVHQHDNLNGTYTVSFTPTKSGSFSVAVSLGGSHIDGSPFPVHINVIKGLLVSKKNVFSTKRYYRLDEDKLIKYRDASYEKEDGLLSLSRVKTVASSRKGKNAFDLVMEDKVKTLFAIDEEDQQRWVAHLERALALVHQ